MNVYYMNGEFCAADRAVIPVDDLALARGYGVFDFLRTYNGTPFFLNHHLERLQHSANQIGLALPWTIAELTTIVLETLRRNDHSESNIRIVVTGGSSPDFTTPQGRPRLMVLVTPAIHLPRQWYVEGVKIITYEVERFLPTAKSLNYLAAMLALAEARKQQAVEAVYVDKSGSIQEGTTSNLFFFAADRLITPADRILSGITRQVVIDMARKIWPVETRPVQIEDLLEADEAFLSSSNKEILPVVLVDQNRIGNGMPGEHTRHLMKLFDDFTRDYAG
jgi:branched-chain amino acid aminotransferase